MGRVLFGWLKARRAVLAYVAVVYAAFFAVYALYGYGWGVAGYAALLGAAAGAGFAGWDIFCFYRRWQALLRAAGPFPAAPLPLPANLLEEQYAHIVVGLEKERRRLEQQGEEARRDAEEYYTLWTHQIKTPMAAMHLLLQGSKGGINRQGKAELEQQLLRIGQYVNMALQYQRLSSLHSDLALCSFKVVTLVNKAAKSCAPLFIHKGVALDTHAVRGEVITDEKWFCFVLEQLFANAVKYTPAGRVRVYSGEGGVLVVEDTGAGIPPADLPRVFERGFTGAAGRSERSATGIGLYLCREVLFRLGFGISIASVLGEGTRVFISLGQKALPVE